jgi:hypothetical protein
MPHLLSEALDAGTRELTHQHIESCDLCGGQWSAYKETWLMMGDLPEVDVLQRDLDVVDQLIELPELLLGAEV